MATQALRKTGKPVVGILTGSPSDLPVVMKAKAVFDDLGIPSDVRVLSAHRTPKETAQYIAAAEKDGVEIFIACAGMAAHLAGVVAAHTTLPVIGVPIASGALQGVDALLSTVQMPPGVPVATMGIDGSKNAAFFAARILAGTHPEVRERLIKQFNASKSRYDSPDPSKKGQALKKKPATKRSGRHLDGFALTPYGHLVSTGRILIFVSVICTLAFGTHYYLWIRLVRDPAWAQPWRTLGTASLILLGALVPVAMVIWRFVPPSISKPIAWAGYLWMGGLFILMMSLWSGEVILWLNKVATNTPPDEARRTFLARVLASGAGALGLSLSGYALYEGLRDVRVKHTKITLNKLTPELDGLRIVQLTDVHIGPTIGREFTEGLVEKVNALEADIVVITGDLVDGSVAEIGENVAPLINLEAKEGVFFVTGNHEYYSGADQWLRFLPTLGIRCLRNERVTISRASSSLDLAGIDDSDADKFGHGADLPQALNGRDTSTPVVLLAHRPRAFPEAKEAGVDLQISGHTHGGQIWPFGYLTRLVEPFILGLHKRGDSQIYVSCGTGYWGPPMRLAAPAEIALLELRSAQA